MEHPEPDANQTPPAEIQPAETPQAQPGSGQLDQQVLAGAEPALAAMVRGAALSVVPMAV